MVHQVSEPRLHHFVPQFYLRRFCDDSGRLWAWNRILPLDAVPED